MKNIKMLILVSIIGILFLRQDYKINKLEKQIEEYKKNIIVSEVKTEIKKEIEEPQEEEETKEDKKQNMVLTQKNNSIKKEELKEYEEVKEEKPQEQTPIKPIEPTEEPQEDPTSQYTQEDYNKYLKYKNSLIKEYGKEVYNLMNQEAGIGSEKESFIYYMENGI